MKFCQEIEFLDRLPLTAEVEFRRRLQALARQVPSPPDSAQELGAYYLARAKLASMLDQDPLPWVRQALQAAERSQAWDQVENTLNFLRSLQGEVRTEPDSQALNTAFSAVLKTAECTELGPLRQTTLELVTSLTSLATCSWHEKQGACWRCLAWLPQPEIPRVSHQLLDRCAEKMQMLLGPAAQLGDSRSLTLSEVEEVTLLPIVNRGRTLAVLYSRDRPADDQLPLLRFVAELAGASLERLLAEEEENRAVQAAAQLNQRWREMMEAAPVGIAIFGKGGECLEKNSPFSQMRGEDLIDWSRPGSQSRTELILRRDPQPRWLQVTDWSLELQERGVRTVVDVSGDEPARWVRFFEEFQHGLASEFHDGAVQLAAAANLRIRTPESSQAFQKVALRLNLLRSPWVEGRPPVASLECLAQVVEPHGRLRIDWEVDEASQNSAEVITSCRILQILVCQLTQRAPQAVHLRVAAKKAWLNWEDSQEDGFQPASLPWIERRLELVGGTLEFGGRGFCLTYPDTES